jgi:hypothetical protein
LAYEEESPLLHLFCNKKTHLGSKALLAIKLVLLVSLSKISEKITSYTIFKKDLMDEIQKRMFWFYNTWKYFWEFSMLLLAQAIQLLLISQSI